MKLGLIVGTVGKRLELDIERIKFAESLGFHSVWTGEAWGPDAITQAAFVLAQTETIKVGTSILQMTARAPTCTAQTALTMNQLSGGRFILGLGASGPQVVEGWHGAPFSRPLARTREYIDIVRQVFAREAPVTHEGMHYNLPYSGADGMGLGKSLKCILEADTSIPIYTASITPKGLETSAEVADGVIPIWMDPDRFDVLASGISKGLATSGRTLEDYAVAPFVRCTLGDDIDACRIPAKANMAFYIGAMGAKNKNFYTDYAVALGYASEAEEIQDLFLSGKRKEAMLDVPDELVDACHLVGPEERIRERLKAWKAANERHEVDELILFCEQPEALEILADELL